MGEYTIRVHMGIYKTGGNYFIFKIQDFIRALFPLQPAVFTDCLNFSFIDNHTPSLFNPIFLFGIRAHSGVPVEGGGNSKYLPKRTFPTDFPPLVLFTAQHCRQQTIELPQNTAGVMAETKTAGSSPEAFNFFKRGPSK